MNALFTYVISIKQKKAHFQMTINILKRNSKHKTEKIAPPFTSLPLACVASVSVSFRSKKTPRKGIFGLDRATAREMVLAPFLARSWTLVPRSLLLNRTETLATQATLPTKFKTRFYALDPC